MSINTILFDMDGVLLDSENAMAQAGIDALKEYGVSAVRSDFIPFTGMGEDSFIGGVAAKYGLKYSTEIKELAYRIYGERHRDKIIVFDGIKELIITLKLMGLKIAVASAADATKVKINLECIGVSMEDFNAVVTGSDITYKKPNPEIFITAAAKVGSPVQECIVIEDAVAGTQAALAAGMPCIGVTSTFDAQTLLKAGCSFAVVHTPDILPILKEHFIEKAVSTLP